MFSLRAPSIVCSVSIALVLAACGQTATSVATIAGAGVATRPAAAPSRALPAIWTKRSHLAGVVDLSAPEATGSLIVAAAGRLFTLAPDGKLSPFASGYTAPKGLEPYIALSTGQRVPAAGCRFPANVLYALRLTNGTGVTVVDRAGHVAKFASLPSKGLENGIAFDETGRFGHRLLVTSTAAGKTSVFAIDCRGHVQVITAGAPRIEGGVAVAPRSFGHFGGDLIAPDEVSGALYAIAPDGQAQLIATSGIPHGQDVGVESEGFVPARYGDALVADRLTPGNPHPGDDVILAISQRALAAAGVAAGDLVVVGEGGANTIAVSCGQSCRVRRVAGGPAEAHIEGHVVFSAVA
jgi:hypothetical protein